MIVADASAVVDLLCRDDETAAAIAQRVAAEPTIHVPALFDLEVLHALRGLEAGHTVPGSVVGTARANLARLRTTRYDHQPFLPRIWELRHNLTAYDATYVALAEALDAPLMTTDGRLARSSGHNARVELVG